MDPKLAAQPSGSDTGPAPNDFESVWVKEECTVMEIEPLVEDLLMQEEEAAQQMAQEPNDESTEKQTYTCDQCEYTSSLLYLLKRHRVVHSSDKPHPCSQCEYSTKHASQLERHIKAKHTDKDTLPKISCELCPYVTYNKWALRAHHRKHNLTRAYKCNHCSFETCYGHHYKRHCRTHERKKDDLYMCEKCNFTTKFKGHLERHLQKLHLEVIESKFRCEYCGDTYKSNSKLKVHKQRSESDIQSCTYCEFETVYKCEFLKHRKTHTDEPYTYPAGQITKVVEDSYVHENNVYKCTECLFETKENRDILTHIKDVHSICYLCHHSFGYKSHLEAHENRNVRETLFVCPYCEFSSLFKCVVRKHNTKHIIEMRAPDGTEVEQKSAKRERRLKEIENESKFYIVLDQPRASRVNPTRLSSSKPEETPSNTEKVVERNKYGQYFVAPQDIDWRMIQVVETHNVDRPFKCYSCEFEAKRKATVQKHFQRHHTNSSLKPFKCVNCEFSTKTKDQIALHNKRNPLSSTPIRCTFARCEFVTNFKCAYVIHQRTHYEFKCDLCNMAYRHKFELARHYEGVHVGRTIKCRHCEFVANRKDIVITHAKAIHANLFDSNRKINTSNININYDIVMPS